MTTLTAPISKLYKRCQWNKHGECPGHFDYSSGQTYSVCSCACHAGVSDMRAAEVVAEAVAIVAPKKSINTLLREDRLRAAKPAKRTASKGARNIAGGLKVPTGHYKTYGHHAWADAEHPSGGDTFYPTDMRIFVSAPISAHLQAQLDTMAQWKKARA